PRLGAPVAWRGGRRAMDRCATPPHPAVAEESRNGVMPGLVTGRPPLSPGYSPLGRAVEHGRLCPLHPVVDRIGADRPDLLLLRRAIHWPPHPVSLPLARGQGPAANPARGVGVGSSPPAALSIIGRGDPALGRPLAGRCRTGDRRLPDFS